MTEDTCFANLRDQAESFFRTAHSNLSRREGVRFTKIEDCCDGSNIQDMSGMEEPPTDSF